MKINEDFAHPIAIMNRMLSGSSISAKQPISLGNFAKLNCNETHSFTRRSLETADEIDDLIQLLENSYDPQNIRKIEEHIKLAFCHDIPSECLAKVITTLKRLKEFRTLLSCKNVDKDKVTSRILEIIESDTFCYIPAEYRDQISGHSLVLKFAYESETTLLVSIINKGNGAEWHDDLLVRDNEIKKINYESKQFRMDIDILRNTQFFNLLSWLKSNEKQEYGIKDLSTEYLIKLLATHGELIIQSEDKFKAGLKASRIQVSKVCSITTMKMLIRDVIIEWHLKNSKEIDVQRIKYFNYLLKLNSIIQAVPHIIKSIKDHLRSSNTKAAEEKLSILFEAFRSFNKRNDKFSKRFLNANKAILEIISISDYLDALYKEIYDTYLQKRCMEGNLQKTETNIRLQQDSDLIKYVNEQLETNEEPKKTKVNIKTIRKSYTELSDLRSNLNKVNSRSPLEFINRLLYIYNLCLASIKEFNLKAQKKTTYSHYQDDRYWINQLVFLIRKFYETIIQTPPTSGESDDPYWQDETISDSVSVYINKLCKIILVFNNEIAFNPCPTDIVKLRLLATLKIYDIVAQLSLYDQSLGLGELYTFGITNYFNLQYNIFSSELLEKLNQVRKSFLNRQKERTTIFNSDIRIDKNSPSIRYVLSLIQKDKEGEFITLMENKRFFGIFLFMVVFLEQHKDTSRDIPELSVYQKKFKQEKPRERVPSCGNFLGLPPHLGLITTLSTEVHQLLHNNSSDIMCRELLLDSDDLQYPYEIETTLKKNQCFTYAKYKPNGKHPVILSCVKTHRTSHDDLSIVLKNHLNLSSCLERVDTWLENIFPFYELRSAYFKKQKEIHNRSSVDIYSREGFYKWLDHKGTSISEKELLHRLLLEPSLILIRVIEALDVSKHESHLTLKILAATKLWLFRIDILELNLSGILHLPEYIGLLHEIMTFHAEKDFVSMQILTRIIELHYFIKTAIIYYNINAFREIEWICIRELISNVKNKNNPDIKLNHLLMLESLRLSDYLSELIFQKQSNNLDFPLSSSEHHDEIIYLSLILNRLSIKRITHPFSVDIHKYFHHYLDSALKEREFDDQDRATLIAKKFITLLKYNVEHDSIVWRHSDTEGGPCIVNEKIGYNLDLVTSNLYRHGTLQMENEQAVIGTVMPELIKYGFEEGTSSLHINVDTNELHTISRDWIFGIRLEDAQIRDIEYTKKELLLFGKYPVQMNCYIVNKFTLPGFTTPVSGICLTAETNSELYSTLKYFGKFRDKRDIPNFFFFISHTPNFPSIFYKLGEGNRIIEQVNDSIQITNKYISNSGEIVEHYAALNTKIDVVSELNDGRLSVKYVSFSTLELNFYYDNVSRKLISKEFPNYYLSSRRSHVAINGLDSVIVLETKHKKPPIIIIPTYEFIAGISNLNDSDENSIQPFFKKRVPEHYSVYRIMENGLLEPSSGFAALYLACIVTLQKKYQLAHYYLSLSNSFYVFEPSLEEAIFSFLTLSFSSREVKLIKNAIYHKLTEIKKRIVGNEVSPEIRSKSSYLEKIEVSRPDPTIKNNQIDSISIGSPFYKKMIEALEHLISELIGLSWLPQPSLPQKLQPSSEIGHFNRSPIKHQSIWSELVRLSSAKSRKITYYSFSQKKNKIVPKIDYLNENQKLAQNCVDSYILTSLFEEHKPWSVVCFIYLALSLALSENKIDHHNIRCILYFFSPINYDPRFPRRECSVISLVFSNFILDIMEKRSEHLDSPIRCLELLKNSTYLDELYSKAALAQPLVRFEKRILGKFCDNRFVQITPLKIERGSKYQQLPKSHLETSILDNMFDIQEIDQLFIESDLYQLFYDRESECAWEKPLAGAIKLFFDEAVYSNSGFIIDPINLIKVQEGESPLLSKVKSHYSKSISERLKESNIHYHNKKNVTIDKLVTFLEQIKESIQHDIQIYKESCIDLLSRHTHHGPNAESQSHLIKIAQKSYRLAVIDIQTITTAILHKDLKILFRLNPMINKENLRKGLAYFVLFCLHTASYKRILHVIDLIRNHERDEKELFNEVAILLNFDFNFDFNEFPEILIYLLLEDKIPRKEQYALIKEIASRYKEDNSLHQLVQFPAGAGKTSLIIPILCLWLLNQNKMPCIINTDELYQSTSNEVPHVLRKYGIGCETLNFELGDSNLNTLEAENFNALLKFWKAQRRCLIIKISNWHAINLAFIRAPQGSEERRQTKKILDFLRQHAVNLIDECQQVLDPLHQHIIASDETLTLPPRHYDLLICFYRILFNIADNDFDFVNLTSLNEQCRKEILPNTLNKIRTNLARIIVSKFPFNFTDNYNKDTLEAYLSSISKYRPDWLCSLNSSDLDEMNLIVLARAFLWTFLKTVLKLRLSINYGPSLHVNDFTAAPYREGKVLSSHFGDPYLWAALSCQLCFQNGVTDEAFLQQEIIALWSQHKANRVFYVDDKTEQQTIWDNGKHYNSKIPDLEFDSFETKESLQKYIKSNFELLAMHPHCIEEFLRSVVLRQVIATKEHYVSTASDMPIPGISFSATPGPREQYPEVDSSQQIFSTCFEGRVICNMLSESNSKIFISSNNNFSTLFQIVKDSLSTVLIDCGGHIADKPGFIRYISQNYPTHPIYYFNNGIIIRELNGSTSELTKSQAADDIKTQSNYLVLYTVSDTTGKDLVLPSTAKAAVTIGKGNTLTHLIQGVMRLRNFSSDHTGQTFSWVIPKSFLKVMTTLKNQESYVLKIPDIINWLISNEASELSDKILARAYQKIKSLPLGGEEQGKEKISLSPAECYENEGVFLDTSVVLMNYYFDFLKQVKIEVASQVIQPKLRKLLSETEALIPKTYDQRNESQCAKTVTHQKQRSSQFTKKGEHQILENMTRYSSELYKTYGINHEVYGKKYSLCDDFLSDEHINLTTCSHAPLGDCSDTKSNNIFQKISLPGCEHFSYPTLYYTPLQFDPINAQGRAVGLRIKGIAGILVCFNKSDKSLKYLALTIRGVAFFKEQIKQYSSEGCLSFAIFSVYKLCYACSPDFKTKINTFHSDFESQLKEKRCFSKLLNGVFHSAQSIIELINKYSWSKENYLQLMEAVKSIHFSVAPVNPRFLTLSIDSWDRDPHTSRADMRHINKEERYFHSVKALTATANKTASFATDRQRRKRPHEDSISTEDKASVFTC